MIVTCQIDPLWCQEANWTVNKLLKTLCRLINSFVLHEMQLFLWPLHWRHNERDNVSNHQPHDCLLNRLFRRRSKKTSKLRVTGLYVGTSPQTGEFPTQMASNAENVFIWWRRRGSVKPTFRKVKSGCSLAPFTSPLAIRAKFGTKPPPGRTYLTPLRISGFLAGSWRPKLLLGNPRTTRSLLFTCWISAFRPV